MALLTFGIFIRKKADTEHLKQLLDDILQLDINYSHSPSESILKEHQASK